MKNCILVSDKNGNIDDGFEIPLPEDVNPLKLQISTDMQDWVDRYLVCNNNPNPHDIEELHFIVIIDSVPVHKFIWFTNHSVNCGPYDRLSCAVAI